MSLCKCPRLQSGHVARKGEKRNAYRILVGNPEEKRDHWEDKDVGEWTIS
jgi:hypothetical protein